MRAVVRGLAAAVVAGMLAAAAGCQSGGPGGGSEPTPPPKTGIRESTPAPSESVFLGEGADDVPTEFRMPGSLWVGEPTDEDVAMVNPGTSEPLTVENVAVTADSGGISIVDDTCTGVELPPGGTCRIRLRHISTEPGPFTGELTAKTSDGNVLTVGVSGETLADLPPGGGVTPDTRTPSPSPGDTWSSGPDPFATKSDPPDGTGGSRS